MTGHGTAGPAAIDVARSRTWLVECYAPGLVVASVNESAARARTAVEVVRGSGQRIEYLGALFVAGDEAVFHAFEAEEEAIVADASRRAGLAYQRIVESVAVQSPGLTDALSRLLQARTQA